VYRLDEAPDDRLRAFTGRTGGASAPRGDPGLARDSEAALRLMHTHRGNPMAVIEAMLAADPECIPAHVLRAAHIVGAGEFESRKSLATSIATIEAAVPAAGDPLRRHALAANAWLAGDPVGALERYGSIVIDDPHDLLALTVAHALDFRLGRRRMLRDRVAQVLPDWSASMPGYASVLAMYAFGLEENGQYRRAEAVARRALELDPGHPVALHAIAHVLEMKGRARDGLDFLAATEPQWVTGTGYSVHLAWHQALFHLDADDPVDALAVYDARIATAPHWMPALADASALLWRLQLRGDEPGSRWGLLADRWEKQTLAGARPFYVAHALMAFAAAGRDLPAARVIEALRATTTPVVPEDALALPLCEALLAFARQDYAACIEGIARVRHLSHQCGGSVAQCDLIHLTLTEAALRARKARLARALAAERAAQKPGSLLNRILLRRAGVMLPAPA
jgi:tetratricopeptide (TPR) repeat protein